MRLAATTKLAGEPMGTSRSVGTSDVRSEIFPARNDSHSKFLFRMNALLASVKGEMTVCDGSETNRMQLLHANNSKTSHTPVMRSNSDLEGGFPADWSKATQPAFSQAHRIGGRRWLKN
jgi:hypothetical protein